MLPNNSLSLISVPNNWLYLNTAPMGSNFAFAIGGIELQNPIQGLNTTLWTVRVLANTQVFLSSENQPEILIKEGNSITHVSLTFDVNMNYYLAYIDSGVAKLDWYDQFNGVRQLTEFGTEVITPYVELDDRRPVMSSNSDVIFSYIRDGKLCHRIQRERFTIERILDDGPYRAIAKSGMNIENRFQYVLIPYVGLDSNCAITSYESNV